MKKDVFMEMTDRLKKGRDPLTNEIMETKGVVKFRDGVLSDETGREVDLNNNGTWIYKQ